MNQVPQERKEAMTKSFAIAGFISIILFSVWLAVQIVSLIPSAFSSLASIADGVYSYRPDKEMVVGSQNSVNNAGEAFSINWTTYVEEGMYYFSYDCIEGVAVSLKDGADQLTVDCATDTELIGQGTAEITVESEKKRFIDLPYTVRFTGTNGLEKSANGEVTIVNASIPTTVVKEESTNDTPAPTVVGQTTTVPSVSTPVTAPESEVVEEVFYAIPASDPNGKIDLAIKLLGVGILDSHKNFIRTGVIGKDQTGSFQFEVRNTGTKTSNVWSYEATMPSGIKYTAKEQAALKPNEYAIITLGFDGLSQTGIEQFGVKLNTSKDTNDKNDSFLSAVRVTE